MSLVIPIVFGLVYYKESLGVLKSVGIVCALLAVYLASIKSKDGLVIKRSNLFFPLLVFVGSGIIDTSIKFLENSFVAENDVPIFSATVFGSAASIGIVILIFLSIRGKLKLQLKNVLGGIVLGIPNYFSVYFLVKALRSDLLDSSGIFTVNNVAIVMISTLVGIMLFKEKLLPKNWLGILLAVVSIFLVTLSGL
jgi:drug/metabolite transporter (DMT)-like permease